MKDIEKIFKCRRCGFCCQGKTTVSLDDNDVSQMSRELGLEPEVLEHRFLRRTGPELQMRTENDHCIFFDDGCKVHSGRPWRCRQWPLVPAILNDEDNFKIIKDSCPGINDELSYQEFCRILKRCLCQNTKLSC